MARPLNFVLAATRVISSDSAWYSASRFKGSPSLLDPFAACTASSRIRCRASPTDPSAPSAVCASEMPSLALRIATLIPLIWAVHPFGDGEAGGVVLGAVDAQARRQALQRRGERRLRRSVALGVQRCDVGIDGECHLVLLKRVIRQDCLPTSVAPCVEALITGPPSCGGYRSPRKKLERRWCNVIVQRCGSAVPCSVGAASAAIGARAPWTGKAIAPEGAPTLIQYRCKKKWKHHAPQDRGNAGRAIGGFGGANSGCFRAGRSRARGRAGHQGTSRNHANVMACRPISYTMKRRPPASYRAIRRFKPPPEMPMMASTRTASIAKTKHPRTIK